MLPTINITSRESYVIRFLQYKNISLINNQHIKSNVVTLNCIFLTYNVPVVTPSAVTLNCISLTYNVSVVTPSAEVFEM